MNKEVLMNAFGQFLDEVLAQRQDDVLGGMVVDAVQQYLGECIDEAVDESINRLDSSAVAETLDLATKYDIQRYVDENCLDRESVEAVVEDFVNDYDFHETVADVLSDCNVVYTDSLRDEVECALEKADVCLMDDLNYAIDHLDLDDQIDNALDYRDLVSQDDLECRIGDLVEKCDLSDAVAEILDDDDLVRGADLEERMDDLGYGAWVDTTAQFMEEMRQKMAYLEMRIILADLEALKNE